MMFMMYSLYFHHPQVLHLVFYVYMCVCVCVCVCVFIGNQLLTVSTEAKKMYILLLQKILKSNKLKQSSFVKKKQSNMYKYFLFSYFKEKQQYIVDNVKNVSLFLLSERCNCLYCLCNVSDLEYGHKISLTLRCAREKST